MNWFDTTLIVVIYYSYTSVSHEGFVKFCVIEVFKFWVKDLMDYGTRSGKSLSLGMPMAPQGKIQGH